jgi:hypothetical protein
VEAVVAEFAPAAAVVEEATAAAAAVEPCQEALEAGPTPARSRPAAPAGRADPSRTQTAP